MSKKLFSIGETSRIKGISKKALRFYERIGLLEPCFVNPENRYRFYSIEQFLHIDIIKAMRVVGISPVDIRAILRRRDTGELLEFLDSQKKIAAHRIEELGRTTRIIEGIQDSIRSSLASISNKGVYRRRIPRRVVVTLPFDGIVGTEDGIIAFARLDRMIEERGLVNAYETGVLFKDEGKGFMPSRIFNTVRVEGGADPPMTSVVPAGEYLCVWFNEENAAEQSAKVTRYCARRGLQPELALQAELLNDVFAEGFTNLELQMLIGKPASA